MNRQVLLLRSIIENPKITQRALCKTTGLALGSVNSLLRESMEEGFVREVRGGREVTAEGFGFLEPYRVDCAVLMAAGFGSRFVPLSFETPKGLLEVFGEPMVERQIRQLIEAKVTDIAIVVGYMKEKFDYLTDKYGVRLIYNPEYLTKNNIASIHAAHDFLKGRNGYILSSDHWIRNNVFHTWEGGAWYAAKHMEGPTSEWVLITDKKGRIRETWPGGRDCDCMYGPAYFSREFSAQFLPVLERSCTMPGTEDYYWEHILMGMLNGELQKRLNAYFGHIPELKLCQDPEMYINLQPDDNVYEFENLEELREFDEKYREDSGSKAMQLVSRVFGVPESQVVRIRRLKAGMTNNSWLFSIGEHSYICRIPGEGTEVLINRYEEKTVFDAVRHLGITEQVVYFDEKSGYKISEFYENSRNADPKSEADMRCCMRKLRSLHESGVRVPHHFDIDERISYYEDLCGGPDRIPFADYREMSDRKDRLIAWLRQQERPEVLSHIDPVPDNFIFLPGADLSETERDESKVRLIDWEYAGMCDPMIDLGMCAIYAYMDEQAAEALMSLYFGREATDGERRLVWAYMALGGFLWALWGVYKEQLGVQFTDYTIKQYRYFKKYSLKVLG